jgi:class 3 adenylate cyclase
MTATADSSASSSRFTLATRTLAQFDVMNFVDLVRGMEPVELAETLDEFYGHCHAAFAEEGGRAVKFLGDAVLGTFPSEHDVEAAVRAFHRVESALATITGERRPGSSTGLRGSVHVGEVAEGRFGPDGLPDIVGADVNTLFVIAGPRRLVLSERAYRRLPNEARSAFDKRTGPTVYLADGRTH